jgi:hypothetical protein
LSLAACGGAKDEKSTPPSGQPIPGGGIGGSVLSGNAEVFVVGADDGPLADATIWIGEGADAKSAGTTGADGHLALDDAALQNGVVLSATLPSHVGATYAGVDGSEITFVLPPANPSPTTLVKAMATITGWDDLPAPAAGKYRAARVAASHPIELAMLDGISSESGADSCFRPAGQSAECAPAIDVHPASVVVLAVIVEGDDAGTPGDTSDDTLEATGLALGPGPGKGGDTNALVLDMLAETDLARATVSLGQKTGLTQVIGVPGVASDNQAAVFPVFAGEIATYPVPKSVGALESAKLWAVGVGRDDPGDVHSMVLTRGVVATSDTVSLPLEDFLEAPAVTQNGAVFELTRSNAGIHAMSIRGNVEHQIWILDERTSVQAPSQIDFGAPSVEVSATEVTEFHPGFLAAELERRSRRRL